MINDKSDSVAHADAAEALVPRSASNARAASGGEQTAPARARRALAPPASAENFRTVAQELDKSSPVLIDTEKEPAKAMDGSSRLPDLDLFPAATRCLPPEHLRLVLEREFASSHLRERLFALTGKILGAREIGPLAVLASEMEGVSLAIAAGLCTSTSVRYLRIADDRFGPEPDTLVSMIEDFIESEHVADLIVDARSVAKQRPFWDKNKNLAQGRAACERAGIRAILIVAASNLKRVATAEDWRTFAEPLQGIETEVVIALAEAEDDRLTREPEQAALRRKLDQHAGIQELWDAIVHNHLPNFVDELQKGHEASQAGRREALFREAVINPDTRDPAQAAALFLGSFVPDLKKQTFLEAHQHLHLIAGSQWRPRKKDKDGELEKWDPSPTDFDRERVGITFENDSTDPILRARIGGAAAAQKFKALFARNGADALRLFIEAGLTTFPLLATGDDKALSALTALTEEKLRREHASPLDRDEIRAEILALALTHAPEQMDDDQAAAVTRAAPIYLTEIAERLAFTGPAFGSVPGAAETAALKLLLEDVLEVARRCELLEQGADWLHDLIARTAFIAPTLRWRMVFSDIYEAKARLRQRALLTDRFWLITIEAVRGRPDVLCLAMREAARLAAEHEGETEDRAFRVQLFSRLLTVWLFAVSEARSDGALTERADSELFDDGFVRELAVALAAPEFNDLHSRLVEIELEVVLRTRGSEPDTAVLERLNHERVIRSTCLAVLHVLLPLRLLDKADRGFLDRFSACIDQAGESRDDDRVPSFFARRRWTPQSMNSEDIEAVGSSLFGKGVSRWLAAMPLAVVLSERDYIATPTPISDIFDRSPNRKEVARRWGKQIDALRSDLLCALEALKSAPREVRTPCESYLKNRLSQLATLRKEILAVFQGN